jgi:hypothetical protein
VSESFVKGELQERVERLRERLRLRLASAAPGILEGNSVPRYLAAFDAIELERSYQVVPAAARAQSDLIVAKHGNEALDLYHRWILLTLIESVEQRGLRRRVPESIRQLLEPELARVVRGVEVAPPDFHLLSNELFVKDFALCRLKLLPCGSEAVDIASGLPRSTLFKGGVRQLIEGGWFVTTRLRGFRPLYESHWDRRLARLFNEDEYNRCYLRIADLLEINPQVRGMFGASWWLDPQVHSIAPELDFLRRVPQTNGARVYRIGPDPGATRDATTFSRKRRELYEAGKYQPERYMLVWARADLLTWAHRFRSRSS